MHDDLTRLIHLHVNWHMIEDTRNFFNTLDNSREAAKLLRFKEVTEYVIERLKSLQGVLAANDGRTAALWGQMFVPQVTVEMGVVVSWMLQEAEVLLQCITQEQRAIDMEQEIYKLARLARQWGIGGVLLPEPIALDSWQTQGQAQASRE